MPIATPEVYAQMLDTAKQQGFAFPAINVTSTQTLNAALKGFADAGSDGIVQISTGGAEYLSGQAVKDMVTGASALAEFAHVVADKYPVHVALHTDHCPKDKLDGYMRPLVAISAERVQRGAGAAVPVAHVGRLGGAAGGEPPDRAGPAGTVRGGPDRHGDGDRRGRRRGGRRRRRDQREAVHHAGRRPGHRRGARTRRARPVHPGRHVRQRARRLQAGPRQAPAGGAEGDPGRGGGRSTARTSRSTWSSTAAPGRRWRRSGRPSPTAWSR